MLVLQYPIVKIRYTTINEQLNLNLSTDAPLESLLQNHGCTPGNSGSIPGKGKKDTFLHRARRLKRHPVSYPRKLGRENDHLLKS
jgi:hypothetical protein